MSLKHAILGFLSFKPLSGYDLKKAFDQSVQHFWPADQSQIYRTLKRLHKDGLIDQQVIPREERLDLKLYAITESGRQELEQWLSTPLPLAENREPFLIQLYFAFMMTDAQAVRLLQAEIDQIDSLLSTFETVHATAVNQNLAEGMERPFFYSMLTLEFGIRANLWYREWLQSVKARVEAGDTSIQTFEELFGAKPN